MSDYTFLTGTYYASSDGVLVQIPGGYYYDENILGRYLFIRGTYVEMMIVYSSEPSLQGWQSVLVYASDPTNILSRFSDTNIISETRDGITYYATTHILRWSYTSYADTNWYYSTYQIINWSTPDYNSDSFISTIDYATASDALSDCIDDILSPSNPSIDINIYTQGSGRNTLYSFLWSNLQNIPDGYTEEDFKIWFGVSDTAGQQGLLARLVDYTDLDTQFDYEDLFNALANTQYPVAEAQDYFYVSANLLYVDDNNENVICNTYNFMIDSEGDITSEGTETGGDINIYIDTSVKVDDSFDDGSGGLTEQAEGLELSVDNLLTTSYVLTEDQLVSFGHFMWANDLQSSLLGNQVAPIENILSCKRIPFEVPGTDADLYIGNVNTGLEVLKSNATYIQDVGTVGADALVSCHNWMDFEPATVISIYLPYIGIQKLQTNLIMYCSNTNSIPVVHSRPITVKYYYDIVYGSCVACVYVTNEDNDLIMIGSFNGECGIDIPITASNRASNQLALIKQGANTTASTIGALTSGNVFGAFGGFIQGNLEQQIDKRTAEVHFQTSGGISSQVASYLPGSVTLFIEHPNYTAPSSYGEEIGYPCNLTVNIGNLTGYTVISHTVNLKNIPCLDEEKEMLLEALTGGFYL